MHPRRARDEVAREDDRTRRHVDLGEEQPGRVAVAAVKAVGSTQGRAGLTLHDLQATRGFELRVQVGDEARAITKVRVPRALPGGVAHHEGRSGKQEARLAVASPRAQGPPRVIKVQVAQDDHVDVVVAEDRQVVQEDVAAFDDAESVLELRRKEGTDARLEQDRAARVAHEQRPAGQRDAVALLGLDPSAPKGPGGVAEHGPAALRLAPRRAARRPRRRRGRLGSAPPPPAWDRRCRPARCPRISRTAPAPPALALQRNSGGSAVQPPSTRSVAAVERGLLGEAGDEEHVCPGLSAWPAGPGHFWPLSRQGSTGSRSSQSSPDASAALPGLGIGAATRTPRAQRQKICWAAPLSHGCAVRLLARGRGGQTRLVDIRMPDVRQPWTVPGQRKWSHPGHRPSLAGKGRRAPARGPAAAPDRHSPPVTGRPSRAQPGARPAPGLGRWPIPCGRSGRTPNGLTDQWPFLARRTSTRLGSAGLRGLAASRSSWNAHPVLVQPPDQSSDVERRCRPEPSITSPMPGTTQVSRHALSSTQLSTWTPEKVPAGTLTLPVWTTQ